MLFMSLDDCWFRSFCEDKLYDGQLSSSGPGQKVQAKVNFKFYHKSQCQVQFQSLTWTWSLKLQGIPRIAIFMICLWETLNFKNCYWLMSHFLPEYGRFVFSTENLIKSLFCGHLGQPKVKCQNQGYSEFFSISWH